MQIPKIYAQNITKSKIDMSLSENPLGCSSLVVKTLQKLSIKDVSEYPNQLTLVDAIANRFNVKPENIVLGCGSEQLIKLMCQTFLTPSEVVLVERGSFIMFTKEAALARARVMFVNLNNIDQLPKSRVFFLANPKTPTGEVIDRQQLIKIAQQINPGILVVDEANGEFLKKSAISFTKKFNNLMVLKTFSKVFGLAGVRIGFAIGSPSLTEELKTAQQPFPVSKVSVKLALASLEDNEFINKTREFIAQERRFLQKELRDRGFNVSNSVTNNLFIETSNASELIGELEKLSVGVIDGNFFPAMPKRGFRISIKDKLTNRLFLDKLDEALSCINSKKLLRSKRTI